MSAYSESGAGTREVPATLPHGSVTFLFTDIEGSTRLNRELDSEYPELLKRYHRDRQSGCDGEQRIPPQDPG